MRSVLAAMVVAVFATGLASAQMKVPQTATSQGPVQITPVETSNASLESARRISRDEAIKMVKEGKAVYVDVRSKDQYDIGHIKGALSIPLSELMTRLKECPPGKFIITYCA